MAQDELKYYDPHSKEQVDALRRSALNSVGIAETSLAEFKKFSNAAPERDWLVAHLERSQKSIGDAIATLKKAQEAASKIAST